MKFSKGAAYKWPSQYKRNSLLNEQNFARARQASYFLSCRVLNLLQELEPMPDVRPKLSEMFELEMYLEDAREKLLGSASKL